MTTTAPTTSSYHGSEDVYRELVEDSSQSWLLGLVAFAVVEEQRIEWMRHYEKSNGLLPSTGQVQVWYQNQPPGALLRARGTAENALLAYSQEVSAAVEAELREEVENGIIVAEIRESKRFWPQFGMNVVGGLASGILFAAILAIFTFLVLNDTSPVDIVKKSSQSAQGVGNGK